MAALTALDAAAVRRWCVVALRELSAAREELNALNVYPVPDGDTGTNLVLTMESAAKAVADVPDGGLPELVQAVARGALLGARGNSGVILSQMFRGTGEVLANASTAGPEALREALRRGCDLAYGAVAHPVEGTVLSVARAAADAATAHTGDLLSTVERACTAAADALDRTPGQLEALQRAGVVDAGGRGLCVVLDALLSVVAGETRHVSRPQRIEGRSALVVAREAGSAEFGYEVQYLLEAPDGAVAALRAALEPLGDSLVVVGGDGLWNVHVHVNDVGTAIERGVEAGRPFRITVTRFDDQIGADVAVAPGAAPQPRPRTTGPRAVVAVVQGDGLTELFGTAGAIVVPGTPAPSTGELLDAIEASAATEVVVLPNDGNVVAAANQAATQARGRGLDVHVIPTRSPVQGLAALAVHDQGHDFAEDAIAMTTAATGTRFAEVTVAVRDAMTSAGQCHAGDVLGLIDGDVVTIGGDVAAVGADVVERMLGAGGELLTVVTGAGCPDGLADELVTAVRRSHPLVEAEVHSGGQPHYPLLLGVE